jgi:hypothetical protein
VLACPAMPLSVGAVSIREVYEKFTLLRPGLVMDASACSVAFRQGRVRLCFFAAGPVRARSALSKQTILRLAAVMTAARHQQPPRKLSVTQTMAVGVVAVIIGPSSPASAPVPCLQQRCS